MSALRGLIIAPEPLIRLKRDVMLIFRLLHGDIIRISDPERDALSREILAVAIEDLMCRPVEVHHVDPLRIISEDEVILIQEVLLLSAFIRHIRLVADLNLAHHAVKFLERHIETALRLHPGLSPGDLTVARVQIDVSETRIIRRILRFEIGRDILAVRRIEAARRKPVRDILHRLRVIAVRPEDTCIVVQRVRTRLQRDMQKIRLILIDEILNRQNEACVAVAPADVRDRSLFDEMAEVQCTDLVAGRSHHVIVLLHDELQLTILRQHRDHIAGRLLSHILQIGMHRIHEVIAARHIGHRQTRLIHRGVHRILPFHRVP